MAATVQSSRRFLMQRAIAPALLEHYTLTEEVLGQGSEAIVLNAVHRKTQQPVAIKFLFKDRLESAAVPIELRVLSKLSHPGLIRYIQHFEDANFFYLVTELAGPALPWSEVRKPRNGINWNEQEPCVGYGNDLKPPTLVIEKDSDDDSDGGFVPLALPSIPLKKTSRDLFECLEKFGPFCEDRARIIFRQIVDVISYLHDNNVFHRDIKDENILISDDLSVRVIDFGSALMLSSKRSASDCWVHGTFGTSVYNAPETIRSASQPCTRVCDENDIQDQDENSLLCIKSASVSVSPTASTSTSTTAIVYPPSPPLLQDKDNNITTLAPLSECTLCYRPAPCDMWSLGVLLYVILNVSIPFDTAWDVLNRRPKPFVIDEAKVEGHMRLSTNAKSPSADARQLITGLLEKNPDERWDILKIKSCAWLQQQQ